MTTIDPTWWTSESFQHEPLHVALRRRDFGPIFGFLRTRGWSVGAIATATGMDEYPVRQIRDGNRRVTQYDVIERIVVGLEIPRHLCGIASEPSIVDGDGSVSEAIDGAGELQDLLGRGRRVDTSAVNLLADQTNQIRRVDRLMGSRAAGAQLATHIETMKSLRRFSIAPNTRDDLAEVMCDATALAGWLALDRGDFVEAWEWHEDSKELGTASVVSLSHALAQQAYLLADAGQPDEARGMADRAVEVAGTKVPPLLAAWLHAVRAEMAATAGDRQCWVWFDRAEALLPANSRDPNLPYVMLDQYHLARWRGTAAALLGNENAIDDLQFALSGLDTSWTRARAGLHADLAQSLLSADHRDQAAAHLDNARSLASQVGSQRHVLRIRRIESRLTAC